MNFLERIEPFADVDADAAADAGHDRALLQLGRRLQADGYRFVTVTPATHQRNNARLANRQARDVRDVFGWSRPFDGELLPPSELAVLLDSGVLRAHAWLWTSEVRWSSLDDLLFVHSGYPTVAPDSVFFGPDTYRFAQAIHAHLSTSLHSIKRAVDIGCGSGAGAVIIARARREAHVLAVDINPVALRFTAVNAALADVGNVTAWHSDVLAGVDGEFDLIVANPPYMQDDQHRAYRDGGEGLGSALSARILAQSLPRLAPGGSLLLYTGAPVVGGVDLFRAQARDLLEHLGYSWSYWEMDPDVFGEELDNEGYAEAERIAAVVLTVTRQN